MGYKVCEMAKRGALLTPKSRASCVVHPPTGNRDALRKRAHYRSYAAQAVTISFTRGAAPSRSHYRGIPRFLPTGSIRTSRGRLSAGFLYSSSILVSVAPRRRCSRRWLLRQKKTVARTKSVDNLNYISHHNPREPVKPTPAFCLGAPRANGRLLATPRWLRHSVAPCSLPFSRLPLVLPLSSSSSSFRTSLPLALHSSTPNMSVIDSNGSIVRENWISFVRSRNIRELVPWSPFYSKNRTVPEYFRKTVNFTVLQQKPRKLQLRLSIGTDAER